MTEVPPTVESGVTIIVIVSVTPAASVPRLAVTVPLASLAVPALALAETNVMPAGSVSVMVVPAAAALPAALLTMIV